MNTAVKIFSFLSFFIFIQNANGCEKVIKITDGDTIVTEKTGVIRILGIDSFDKSEKYIQQQIKRTQLSKDAILYLREQGKLFAESKLLNQCVDIIYDKKTTDIFNRNLAYIEINKVDYSELILLKKVSINSNNNDVKTLDISLANVYCKDKSIIRFNRYNQISQFKCE